MSGLELLRAPARQSGSLSETEHRPWPLPEGQWLMGHCWEDLLFAHWGVHAEEVKQLLPPGLTVDEHDGSAWLGITPFELTCFRLRGTPPLPVVSRFPEINVRTYVTAEDKPGIWFFSLDTSSLVAVEAARRAYKLPYFHARISMERREDGGVRYSAARRKAVRPFAFDADYAAAGEPGGARAGDTRALPGRALLPLRGRRVGPLPRGDPPPAVAAPPGRRHGQPEHDAAGRARARRRAALRPR